MSFNASRSSSSTSSSLFGSTMPNISMNAMKDFSDITDSVRSHLKNVYATLCVCMLAAAIGAAFNLYTGFLSSPFIATLGVMACMFALSVTSPEKMLLRLSQACGVSFLSGASIAPLIDLVLFIDASIITAAFFCSAAIFGSFSAAALFSKRRSYLYLGGLLSSALSIMFFLSLWSLFFGSSELLFNVRLYGGLFVMAGFTIFDTQMIVERASAGDRDFIMHAVQLFVDFFGIFVRILIIMSKNSGKDKRRSNNRR